MVHCRNRATGAMHSLSDCRDVNSRYKTTQMMSREVMKAKKGIDFFWNLHFHFDLIVVADNSD